MRPYDVVLDPRIPTQRVGVVMAMRPGEVLVVWRDDGSADWLPVRLWG